MNVEIKSVEVIVNPEFNAAEIIITPTFSSGVPDVNKQYVDEKLLLKVDKVEGSSLVPDTEIDKLAGIEENANDYTHPLTHPASILEVVDMAGGSVNKFLNEQGEMVEVSHEKLTDKNSEAAFQHVDATVTKETLDEADKVALYDSVTGNVVLTPKSNLNGGGSQLLADYTHTANKEVNVESINFATSVITATAHGLSNGNLVVAANNYGIFVEFPYAIIPNGIGLSTQYYVVNKTENTFQLSLTSGGAAVAITDKDTKDYTKWHFEILGAVDFINLPNLKKARIILNGKSFITETPASYFLFYKNNKILLSGMAEVWSQSGGRYGNSSANRLLIDVVSRGQCYNYHDVFIDFSLYRATLIVNGSRLYAVNNTSNASVIKNNATYVHVTDGNIDFDKISINNGVPNGFNIKIYSA